ncbi:hypothetical protein PF003_g3326 [Phytophthora fragariae]|nr:hypothetical protein PF003_g3326 [Phytophthora fragariae]
MDAPTGPPCLWVRAVHGAAGGVDQSEELRRRKPARHMQASLDATLGPSFATHVRLDSTLIECSNGPSYVASGLSISRLGELTGE